MNFMLDVQKTIRNIAKEVKIIEKGNLIHHLHSQQKDRMAVPNTGQTELGPAMIPQYLQMEMALVRVMVSVQ